MAWTLTGSLDDYIATAGEFLRSRPVHNTIQLTALLFRLEPRRSEHTPCCAAGPHQPTLEGP
jgi:hypothetical protein